MSLIAFTRHDGTITVARRSWLSRYERWFHARPLPSDVIAGLSFATALTYITSVVMYRHVDTAIGQGIAVVGVVVPMMLILTLWSWYRPLPRSIVLQDIHTAGLFDDVRSDYRNDDLARVLLAHEATCNRETLRDVVRTSSEIRAAVSEHNDHRSLHEAAARHDRHRHHAERLLQTR